MNISKLSLAGLVTLTACPGSVADTADCDTGDTADTDCDDDTADPCEFPADDGSCPTQINGITPVCTGPGEGGVDNWTFTYNIQGDGQIVELDIVETGAAPETRWQENGHTSDAALTLALTTTGTQNIDGINYPLTDQVVIAVAGSGNTAFNCSYDNGSALAFKASLIDSTNVVADCIVWGHNATTDAWAGTTCICLDC